MLPDLVALLDHHLLSQEDFLCGDLHTKIPTSNHDGIRCLQDVIKVLDSLLVLYFADDLNLPALWSQNLQDHIAHRQRAGQWGNVLDIAVNCALQLSWSTC